MSDNSTESKLRVVVRKNILIPMRDGIELAADFYMPDRAGKYPAIIELTPYHKDDLQKESAEHVLGYFAERGYVGVEVDVRGTGSSGGSAPRGLCLQHQLDAYDMVEWVAKQPYCDGNVGMIGVSYGGWTALTAAIQNPPHLRAIVPINITDDFYLANYPGGSLGGYLFILYDAYMLALNCQPSLYRDPESRWLRIWQEHLENISPWFLPWIQNQTSDASVWHESSFADQLEKITAPTFVIGGWHDIYPLMPRIYSGIKAPKRLMMGPWSHVLPDTALPGPRIDYLFEAIRWFDFWLKKADNGTSKESPIAIYVQKSWKPEAITEEIPGSWRYEREWPIKRTIQTPFYLNQKGELKREIPSDSTNHESNNFVHQPTVGTTSAGKWISGFNINGGMPIDQRLDEALSTFYTSETLVEDVEVTGVPRTILNVSSSADIATFVARLSDIGPNAESVLVATGRLNGTHRTGHREPKPLTPGENYELVLDLDTTSYIFQRGHRIRLAISSSDFPCTWPSPKAAVNTVYCTKARPSRIILPVLPRSTEEFSKPRFRLSPTPPLSGDAVWRTIRDEIGSKTSVEFSFASDLNIGVKAAHKCSFIATASTLDPEDTNMKAEYTIIIEGPSTSTRISALSNVQSRRETLEVFESVSVVVDGAPYFNRSWSNVVKRRLL